VKIRAAVKDLWDLRNGLFHGGAADARLAKASQLLERLVRAVLFRKVSLGDERELDEVFKRVQDHVFVSDGRGMVCCGGPSLKFPSKFNAYLPRDRLFPIPPLDQTKLAQLAYLRPSQFHSNSICQLHRRTDFHREAQLVNKAKEP